MDRNRRTVVRAECAGVEASAEQLRAGLAWAFVRYLHDARISELQATDRAAALAPHAEPHAA